MLTAKQFQVLQKRLEDKKADAMIANAANIVDPAVQASNSGVYNTCVEIQTWFTSVLNEDDDDEGEK